jgi:hypothetical protein
VQHSSQTHLSLLSTAACPYVHKNTGNLSTTAKIVNHQEIVKEIDGASSKKSQTKGEEVLSLDLAREHNS